MIDHIFNFGRAWYWALTIALTMVAFGFHRDLCIAMRKDGPEGGMRYDVNRFKVGFLILAFGFLLNTITWGAVATADDLSLPSLAMLVTIAQEARAITRPAMTLGCLVMLTGLSEDRREWFVAWAAVATVFLLSLAVGALR